jgi:hypothetical protein
MLSDISCLLSVVSFLRNSADLKWTPNCLGSLLLVLGSWFLVLYSWLVVSSYQFSEAGGLKQEVWGTRSEDLKKTENFKLPLNCPCSLFLFPGSILIYQLSVVSFLKQEVWSRKSEVRDQKIWKKQKISNCYWIVLVPWSFFLAQFLFISCQLSVFWEIVLIWNEHLIVLVLGSWFLVLYSWLVVSWLVIVVISCLLSVFWSRRSEAGSLRYEIRRSEKNRKFQIATELSLFLDPLSWLNSYLSVISCQFSEK